MSVKRLGFVARAVGAVGLLSGATAVIGQATPAATAPPVTASTCQLGNGVQHVIHLTFDNVHFFRDNPNVPSDLEQMPHLLNFIEGNGTMLSNNHTPLIAHTANDSLTAYTGLYGDRHGMPISNSYEVYNGTGGVDSAGSFQYWTAPINDRTTAPAPGPDALPGQLYSATVPATQSIVNGQPAQAPAPWVPFTRAGCNVGDVSTANMVLENALPDIPTVFGATSPEAAQTTADADHFKDAEVADYVGLSVHCAAGATFCASASGLRGNQTTASPTAVTDALPTEPGGYSGFQALHGHRYVAPQVGAGTPSLAHNGYAVTNAAGNLVDLAGNEIDGAFLTNHPGFPGFGGISAAQSLAYVADMQESGVPVTYGYISDLHEQKSGQTGCTTAGKAIGPGDSCYAQTAKAYDDAFNTFFTRLAADGITPANSLFVITADEGDHFAGANVGRSIQPSCTAGPQPVCSYPAGQSGEVSVNIHGLVTAQTGNTTPFYSEPQGAAIYTTGNQPAPTVRQLQRDFGAVTANDPYEGNANTPVVKYLADPQAEQLLHFTNADPNRTPSFTVFPNPDMFFSGGRSDSCGTGTTAANANTKCASLNPGFAYNHGYYSPEIVTTWLGLVGPGVAHKGVDGKGPAAGPGSYPGSTGDGTVPGDGTTGTWADHTDIRPTLLALTDLQDDYPHDGRVLVEDMTAPPATTLDPRFVPLAVCSKQLNASVGRFGTDVLVGTTAASKTGSTTSDATYASFEAQIGTLGASRDALATTIKGELDAAATGTPLPAAATSQTAQCLDLLTQADTLAGISTIRPTTLTADPAIAQVGPGVTINLPNLVAHLSDPAGPVSGAPVAFTTTKGAPICSGVTDATGTARCPGSIAAILSLGLGYQATFGGNAIDGPSSAHGTLLTLLGLKLF